MIWADQQWEGEQENVSVSQTRRQVLTLPTITHTYTHTLTDKDTTNCFSQFEEGWVKNECHYGKETVLISYTNTIHT